MTEPLTDRALADLLGDVLTQHWPDLVRARVEPLGGGMNSATARVRLGSRRHVAKWVPAENGAALRRGGERAARVQRATGIRTGPPLPAADGALVVHVSGGWLSLLADVGGIPLDGVAPAQQLVIAEVLAAVHEATSASAAAGEFLPAALWRGDHLDVEPWVRTAVGQVLDEYRGLGPQPWATVHTDPAPEAFRLDGDEPALIDWTGATDGPVMYDVASVVMYLGGPARAATFLRTYQHRTGTEGTHLDAMRRYRQAVQAAYFAMRLVADDRTGLVDPAGNRAGLEDARRGLAALGVRG